MKQLIKMQKNWKFDKPFFYHDKPKIIVVSNYDCFNEINQWQFTELNGFYKSYNDIGIWHVKYKELKSK